MPAEFARAHDCFGAADDIVEAIVEGLEQRPAGRLRRAATMARASSAFSAKAFSQSTALPACAARMVHSAWPAIGLPT